MHADWLAVLEIYLYIHSIEPRAFLLEDAICKAHNEKSFRDTIFTPRSWTPNISKNDISPENLNHLYDELCSGNRDLAIRLFLIGDKAAPLIPLIGETLQSRPEYQSDIIRLISTIGNPASKLAPLLIKIARKTNDPAYRYNIITTLGDIQTIDPDAIALIMDSLQNAEVWEQYNMLKALLKMRQEQLAIPLLLKKIKSSDVHHSGCWNNSSFADLFKFTQNTQSVIPELKKQFMQNHPSKRLVAAIAMDALATTQKPECAELANIASQDTWDRIRRIAVTTLSRLPRSEFIRSAIQHLTNDKDQEVSARAKWALEFGVIQSQKPIN